MALCKTGFLSSEPNDLMIQARSIADVLRNYWKYFVLAWTVPVLMMAETIWEDISGIKPSMFIINTIFAFFLISFASWVWLPFTDRVRQSHAIILGMLMPLMIWVVLGALRGILISVV